MDRSTLPMHVMEEAEKTHVEKLNRWEKKVYKQAEDDYFKFRRIKRQNFAMSYGILLGLCEDSLKSRLGAEIEFQNMVRNKGFCVMKLHHLIKKVCNGSSGLMVEDVVGNMMEAMCSMIFVKGEDNTCLPKYL